MGCYLWLYDHHKEHNIKTRQAIFDRGVSRVRSDDQARILELGELCTQKIRLFVMQAVPSMWICAVCVGCQLLVISKRSCTFGTGA